MKVVITGSGGYIGKKLIEKLQSESHTCIPIKREFWNGKIERISELLANTDVVINLAGTPILKRWTFKNMELMYNSRVLLTQKLVSAIHLLPEEKRPTTFISASAIGIYKSNEIHTELSNRFDDSFSGKLVQNWEAASVGLPHNVRRIIFRIGLVLGNDSKTIKTMLPVFKLGLGGKIGNGKQAFPFIHINDLLLAFSWAIENANIEGVFNLVAPQKITNQEFTQQLSSVLKKPVFLPIPVFILRLVFGKASQLLTTSPEVVPEKLIHKGFIFSKPTIIEALSDLRKGQ